MSLVPVAVPEIAIPDSREIALAFPSHVLYKLELAGQIAREVLDERIIEWTEEGWSQRQIADELGCSQQAISKRQERLGIQPSQPHQPRSNNQVVTRKEVEPERPSQYLPDLLDADSPRNLRTQIVRWCELGRHIESLLDNRADLEPKSEEDLRLILAEVAAMSQLAKRLGGSIPNG